LFSTAPTGHRFIEAMIRRENRTKGFFVSLDYSRDALTVAHCAGDLDEEIARV
jgi:hypothetical protein